MFKAVTLASEYGSGGHVIARAVAEKLRWNLLDRALVNAVANVAQVDAQTAERLDEHVDSWWHRFNRGGIWSAAIMAGMAPDDARRLVDAETMAAFSQKVILKAAATGDCVIVGRGAQCVLQDRADVLHVFIYAPWPERVGRVRARLDPSQNIGELIHLSDQERATYIRTYYGCAWKDPHLYHMMISSHIGAEVAARMIVNAVKEPVSRDQALRDRR